MKIGIITILKVNNYGAELQAFATQHVINNLGHDSEIIDYFFYKNPKFKKTKRSKSFVKLSLKQSVKEFLYPWYKKIKTLPHYKAKKKRDDKFIAFHDSYTKLSIPINTIDKLYKTSFTYDTYVVGSDQVWNPNTNINIEPYFLTFAPADKKKVSYASSFGVSELPKSNQPRYKNYLEGFDHLGVREKQGKKIVDNLTTKEATWVLDPTLLMSHSDWEVYSESTPIKEPYILLYVLTDADYITNLARKIAESKKMRIVRICKNSFVEDKSEDVINIIDAGPKEYLGLFSKASFVLTTSFHGTCFSVNFNKPFYTILKKNKTNNSRQIDLLEELGIGERIIYVGDAIPDNEKFMDIDFSLVNSKLSDFKDKSFDYLTKALNS